MRVALWGGLTRMLTLTLVGEEWQTVRNRVKRLRHELVDEGKAVDWIWCVEPNPKLTGHHVHGLVGGDYVDAKPWREAADRVGLGGRVGIEKLRKDAHGVYMVKSGLYAAKSAFNGYEALQGALGVNGGRLVHWSRRPFRGLAFPEARKRWLDSIPGPKDEGPWYLEYNPDRCKL